MTIITRRPWGHQPPFHSGINRNLGLASGLMELSLATSGPLVSSRLVPTQNVGATSLTSVAGKSGWARRASNSPTSSTQYEQVAVPHVTAFSAFTLYARLKVGTESGDAGTSPITARYIYSFWASSTQAFGFGCPGNGLINAISQGGGNRVNTTITATANVEYDCFLSHPGGTAGFTLTVLGVSSNTTATTSLSLSLSAPFIQVGANLSTSSAGDKYVICGGLWRRVLSAEEMASIGGNPWQLFAPRKIIIPSAAAAAGTYTLSSATYAPGSITATGVTPRVSVAVT